ncbi:MAG TPA: hypothetical protein VLM91_25615 [Candidatus Methylomirabilis sp.]|nr:hypothetical protein [Candidatus Methylomirabilis sp.]
MSHAETTKRRLVTIYCKGKEHQGQAEVCVGLEISEGVKRSDSTNDPIRAEGRVFLRFFSTDQPKEQHIRTMLEPWEAFQLSRLIQQAVEAKERVELKPSPHKFTRNGEDVVTSVLVEKWVRESRADYAIKALRKGLSYNVSMSETNLLWAGEMLRALSTAQAWQEQAPRD